MKHVQKLFIYFSMNVGITCTLSIIQICLKRLIRSASMEFSSQSFHDTKQQVIHYRLGTKAQVHSRPLVTTLRAKIKPTRTKALLLHSSSQQLLQSQAVLNKAHQRKYTPQSNGTLQKSYPRADCQVEYFPTTISHFSYRQTEIQYLPLVVFTR